MTHPINDLSSLSPSQRALLELRLRQRRREAPSTAIPPRADSAAYPLSFAQQRLWFIDQLDPGNAAYNISGAVRLTGPLRIDALTRALEEIVGRHDVLRSSIAAVDGQPAQRISAPRPFDLPILAVPGGDDASRLAAARGLASSAARRLFDLSADDPLLRATLLRFDAEDHVLVLTMHHVASDGWSTGVVLRELTALYEVHCRDGISTLAPLPIQYADYAAWQREGLHGDALAQQVSWWREALAGAPVLELPGDRLRPAAQSSRGARHTRSLSAELSRRLSELSRRQGVTLFMTLLAAFDVLLSRYTGSTDIVVGSPVAGRNRRELEDLVGLFVNTLVLRADVSGEMTFTDLLRHVQQGVLDALAHQDVPFEMLVDEIRPERTLSHSPLTSVVFAFQNVPSGGMRLADIDVTSFEFERTSAQFDLCLFVVDAGNGLTLAAEYSTDLFEESTIAHMLRAFETLLGGVVAEPDSPVAALSLAGADERDEAVDRWNQTTAAYPRGCRIDELFEDQAHARPDAVALVAGDRRLTYRQLNEEANRLARHLESLGVGRDALVGVCLERSIEMIVALLAIVKAGAAYVPLDPAYPDGRLAQLLDDCGAGVLVTDAAQAARFDRASAACVCVDGDAAAVAARPAANEPARGSSTDRVYLMYTSGSTGVPKGVEVVHHGITRLLFGVDYVSLGPAETILQLAPYSFDASTFEIWGALLHGGRLVLYPDRIATPRELGEALRAHEVTTLWLTGSLYNVVIDEAPEALGGLRQLLIGGDALSVPHVRRGLAQLPGVQIVNGYGPTESTTFACCERIARDLRADARSVPIGRPIGNTRVYLLDPRMQPVPVGAPGELYIGGDGLARGYFRDASLTAERFVADPFRPGERLYRSGDLARYLPDGRIEFLGRIDQQVKIRGYRIECGEIESALVALAGVREAIVVPVPQQNGQKRLVAYLVPDGALESSAQVLRRQLLEKLPDYMVPSAFVFLPSLPLNRNGKVDRGALPDPAAARSDVEAPEGRVAPRNDREAALARIWAAVLRLDQVGVYDNFFELGGDSILSIQIVARANDAGLMLRPRDIFKHQTIADLAQSVGISVVAPAEQGPVVGPAPLTPIQCWFFDQDAPNPHHFNQAILLDVAQDANPVWLEGAVAAIVEHHDALRLNFDRNAEGAAHGVIHPPDGGTPLTVLNLTGTLAEERAAKIEAAADAVHRSLRLDGAMVRFALLRLGDAGARLLCVVHHLAIDGVSWRVLLEDLRTAYNQLQCGEPVRLPAKTTSWRAWANRLTSAAGDPDIAAETDYWLAARLETTSLPADAPFDPAANTIGNAEHVSAALTSEETASLLQDVPGAFHTQINDVLLTGLSLALRGWMGQGALLIDLEGHGREPLFDDVDVSRTVGWFTTLYPVRLELPQSGDPIAALKRTKERLRAIPRQGIGYGLLRYFAPDAGVRHDLAAQPAPALSFNYLGRFDPAGGEAADAWHFAPESPGRAWDERTPRAHLIDVTAVVVDGTLRVTWTYNPSAHRRETIETLASALLDGLRRLISACTAPGVQGWTPSDFPLVRLDQDALERLHGRHPALADLYPLSPLQHGLLFHALSTPSGAYVEQMSFGIAGPFSPAAFKAAWVHAIERHAVLRTVFDWQELDSPIQIVLGDATPAWTVEDWRDVPADARAGALAARMQADAAQGFALDDAPPVRFALLRLDEQSWRFVWSFHHILVDGWCMPIILRDVAAAYAAVTGGLAPEAPALAPYRDYIAWLQAQDPQASEGFWRQELAGVSAPTPLPVGRSGSGPGEARLHLSDTLTLELQSLARREQLTLNTIVQAAWALLLARATGERDVIFGTTMSGRPATLRGVETMVGLFINTLPLKVTVDGSEPLVSWLRSVQASHLAVREHEHVGLFEVQRWAALPGGQPLFDTLVVFENYPLDSAAGSSEPAALRLHDFHVRERTNYALTLVASPGPRLRLKILSEGIAPDVATRLLECVENILGEFASRDRSRIGQVALLSERQRGAVLALGAGTWAPPPEPASIGALFDVQAASRAEAEAVVCGADRLTYAELQRRSNRWAHLLRARGVGPDVIVGVCLDAGVALVEVLLGIIKAGGAYLALDPSYPAARLGAMIRDTRAHVIVTESRFEAQLPSPAGAVVIAVDRVEAALASQLDAAPRVAVLPDHLAYVSYTSGSTGVPKGVAIPHRGVLRLLFGVDYAHFGADETWLQLAPIGFDASTLEVWGALLHGGRLVVAADRMPTPRSLGALLREERVTAMWLTASLYNTIVDVAPDAFSGVRQLIIGGEALSVAHVQRGLAALPSTQIINGYGPTESTTFTCCYPIPSDSREAKTIPIGRPIGRTRVRVLDASGEPVPVGMTGELYIGGEGLARGYVGQPAATADRFVPDAVSGVPGARLYRTGDIVRWTSAGVIEFVGRADAQVKVRGFRIEPGEIETALLGHPAAQAAAVVMREDTPGVKRLVAYLVAPPDAAATDEELRIHLQSRLPEYMVPAAFVWLSELPLNRNGKLDRRALPAPQHARHAARRLPALPAEETLAVIWSEVLGRSDLGVDDNFFELGGDSILSIQICARAQRAGLEITPKQLFEHQTIATLAATARRRSERTGEAMVSGAVPLLPVQRWWLDQDQPDLHHFNQAMLLDARPGVTAAILETAIPVLLEHHDALRARFARTASGWTQTIEPPSTMRTAGVSRVDLSAMEPSDRPASLERAAAALQASLDLEKGPLVRIALFDLGRRESRLLIAIHHLVVDAVSWRILLEDLDTVCQQLLRGERPGLPQKTNSVRQWAERLKRYADEERLAAARASWIDTAALPACPLPIDYPGGAGANTVGASARVHVSLSAAETQALLQDVPKAYQTQINDALLTALVEAIGPWAQSSTLVVDLEGHGRELLFDDLDVSRTVGWFTTMTPARLALPPEPDAGSALRAVKEQLRGLHGVAYGALRFLSSDASVRAALAGAPAPDIAFNYLGQFDRAIDSAGLFAVAPESPGQAWSPRQRRAHLIDVNGVVSGGQLQLDWIYCPHLHSRATIDALAQRYLTALRALIGHCLTPGVGGYTPSDFPMADLGQDELNEVLSQVEFE